MKLRVLKKNVYISKSQMGWGKSYIDKSKDVLQMWDDKEGWLDVPVVWDNIRVTDSGINGESY